MASSVMDAEAARKAFAYCPDTGELRWAIRSSPRACPGALVRSRDKDGYVKLSYLGKCYRAHRVIWLMVTGHWPKHQVDHINGVTDDNRLANLREATQSENQQNRRGFKTNSGYPGVTLDKSNGKYRTGINVNGRKIYLGHHDDPELAALIRSEAKRKYHTFAPECR